MGSKSKVTLALLALAAVAMAIPAFSAAGQKAVELESKLTGKAEVPGPGSKKGKGEVQLFVKAPKEKVCFTLEVKNLDPIVAGHIHKGAADVAGKVKVTLFEDAAGISGDGNYQGCVKNVKSKLLKKIASVPEKFYVNIHTMDYPDGAIRGQLAYPAVTR